MCLGGLAEQREAGHCHCWSRDVTESEKGMIASPRVPRARLLAHILPLPTSLEKALQESPHALSPNLHVNVSCRHVTPPLLTPQPKTPQFNRVGAPVSRSSRNRRRRSPSIPLLEGGLANPTRIPPCDDAVTRIERQGKFGLVLRGFSGWMDGEVWFGFFFGRGWGGMEGEGGCEILE